MASLSNNAFAGIVRTSQRLSLACQECTKRKVKCDKQLPCARCRRLKLACAREKVGLRRNLLQHEDQIRFLRSIIERLEVLPFHLKLHETIQELRSRIQRLQFGHDISPSESDEPPQALKDRDTDETQEQTSSPLEVAIENADPSLLTTLEHLAWGRVTGKCFPHKTCRCEHHRRRAALLTSDFSSPNCLSSGEGLPPMPAPLDAKKLIQFHVRHLAWHHNCLHGPTFEDQCEVFWKSGTCVHPLWLALYFSILSATVFAVQNSDKSKSIIDIDMHSLPTANELFSNMISVLYRFHFLHDLTIYTVQAIVISTEVSHNLGQSQLNATLFNAAVRIAECLGLHRINESGSDDWDTKVEKETGKRVWCQITVQDHFAIPFTESYSISPGHVSTTLPSNADDHDLLHQHESLPTVSSYVRVLAKMAAFMPELLDGLGPVNSQRPLQDQYMHVLSIDSRMRDTVKRFPPFFLRSNPEQEKKIPWLGMARRSLAITAAEKIIMIHRPFLFRSFQIPLYDFTRRTCIAAATTILREHESLDKADDLSIWTHTAFCITATVILCFEIYKISKVDDVTSESYRSVVKATRDRLVFRQSDLLAQRGVALIDVLLLGAHTHEGEFTLGKRVMDFDYIATALFPTMGTDTGAHDKDKGIYDTFTGEYSANDTIMEQFGDIHPDYNFAEVGFDNWFNDMFMNNTDNSL